MDADRFDRWTRLLAARMSRRTAAASLGVATVASLAAPRWALGQDDDEDQDADVDQHKDNPTGEDPDDDGQTDDNGGDDTSDDDENLDLVVCLPITRCMREHCTDNTGMDGSGECHWDDIGPIPGGPYPQEWSWSIPPCWPKADVRELEAKCNAAYPGNNCPHCCNNECAPCTELSLAFCH